MQERAARAAGGTCRVAPARAAYTSCPRSLLSPAGLHCIRWVHVTQEHSPHLSFLSLSHTHARARAHTRIRRSGQPWLQRRPRQGSWTRGRPVRGRCCQGPGPRRRTRARRRSRRRSGARPRPPAQQRCVGHAYHARTHLDHKHLRGGACGVAGIQPLCFSPLPVFCLLPSLHQFL